MKVKALTIAAIIAAAPMSAFAGNVDAANDDPILALPPVTGSLDGTTALGIVGALAAIAILSASDSSN